MKLTTLLYLGLPIILNVTIAAFPTTNGTLVSALSSHQSSWYPIEAPATLPPDSTTNQEQDQQVQTTNDLEEVASTRMERSNSKQKSSSNKTKSKKRLSSSTKKNSYRTNSRSTNRFDYRYRPLPLLPYYNQVHQAYQQFRRRPVRPLNYFYYDFDDYYDFPDDRRRYRDYRDDIDASIENIDKKRADSSDENASVEEMTTTTMQPTTETTQMETTTKANSTETTTPWHGYFYGYGPSNGHEHVSITYAPWENNGGLPEQSWASHQDQSYPFYANDNVWKSVS